MKKKKEDENLENQNEKQSRSLPLILIPILAIAGIVTFFLTQNLGGGSVMADGWTPVHIALVLGGILCYVFSYKRSGGNNQTKQKSAA